VMPIPMFFCIDKLAACRTSMRERRIELLRRSF